MRGIKYTAKSAMLADFSRVEYLTPTSQEVVLIGESAIKPDLNKPLTEWVQVGDDYYIVADPSGLVEAELNNIAVHFSLNNYGRFVRHSGNLDDNGNIILEQSECPILSDGTMLNEFNRHIYEGEEGWEWYEGEVGIITPSTWETIENWFKRS